MSDELKPCPFCGSTDIKTEVEVGIMARSAKCYCNICGASVSGMGVMIPEDSPEEELIESAHKWWNRREEA